MLLPVEHPNAILLLVAVFDLVLGAISSVEDIVLEEKDGVEEDRGDRQDKLDCVEGPWLEERLIQRNRVQSLLKKGKRATGQVKQDVFKRPAHCALPLPVQVHLRQVLDKGDGCLRVAHHENGVCSLRQWVVEDINAPVNKDCAVACDQEDDPEHVDASLGTTVVDKDLGQLD